MTRGYMNVFASAISIVVLACSISVPLLAQTENRLEDCAQIQDNDLRLECFDQLLGEADPEPAPVPEPESAPEPAPVPAAVQSADPAPVAETAAPVAAEEVAAEEAEAPSRRQRNREERNQPPVTVTIIAVQENFAGRTFTTEDGQVWEQTSTNMPLNPDPPFSAEIERASFGSYFLTPEGGRRTRVSLRQ